MNPGKIKLNLMVFLPLFLIPMLILPCCTNPPKPNILWLVSEDNSPFLGCYGDPNAYTPNLDQLASEGIRYTNAYATSPVCSAARSTLINGAYGLRFGIHHHRSAHRIPDWITPYPIFFREAGYYCTNNAKKDYNLINDQDCWNESSNKAHYKNRKPGQPFFAIFNFAHSHESRTFPKDVRSKREKGIYPAQSRVDPQDISLPNYHPDHPDIRQEWADYYDAVTHMDAQIGEQLRELDSLGLREETIIVYYSDHGGALARGKRSIKDSGTKVPLIIYFPEKWQHLAPDTAGGTSNRLISFVDFPATMLSIMDVAIPEQMDGLPFLGEADNTERSHVFLYRGRMDARYDMVRAIRTLSLRYVVNYTPHRPNGQHYLYADKARTSPIWRGLWQEGSTNKFQSQYWELKPGEQLFNPMTDPDEVIDVFQDPQYQDELIKLRKMMHQEIVSNRDVGFIPESMYSLYAGDSSLYQFAQSEAYQLEAIKEVADRAIRKKVENLDFFKEKMKNIDPLIRYWACLGAVVLQEQAMPLRSALFELLEDPIPEVRIAAAEALGYLQEDELAVQCILDILEYKEDKDIHLYTLAADVLDYLDLEYVSPHMDILQKIAGDQVRYGNAQRVAEGLLQQLQNLSTFPN